MKAHQEEHAISKMCQVLKVGRSGYYAWRKREPSARAQANQVLTEEIRRVHLKSRCTYGSPRVHAALLREGIVCGRNRVARLMRRAGLVGRRPKRHYPRTTQRQPGLIPAPNLLNREFVAHRPNQKWVVDITYIDTAEGWLYLAPVLDLFGRKIVGWAMANHMESELVESALRMAFAQRHPDADLLHHSDQGSQYTSSDYLDLLKEHRCQISMSGVGNCYDNAVMESFFSTLKTECAGGQFESHAQARTAIFEYIEVWYNRQRLHSSLGYLSPVEFEAHLGH
jgi:putative transposase